MNAYHRSPRGFSRRNLLYGGGLVAVSAAASGCGLFDTEPATESGEKGPEAPMLAERVEAGELPPVEERLPAEADRLVVEPTERIGVYGGVWRTAYTDAGDAPWFHRTIGYETLMRWTRDWSTAVPNVAKSITPSADGREFEIKLRQGMRWSDGEPFTTADLDFAFNHIMMHPSLPDSVHHMLRLGETPAEFEVVDDLTAVIRFAGPNGMWVLNNARQVDGDRLLFPRHYCEQFHPDFSDDAVANAEAAGFNSWEEYFNNLIGPGNLSGPFTNPDLPTLKGWVVVEPMGQGTRAVFERNPYYWKVDPEGSQLPYLDRVEYEVISDNQQKVLRAANGEFDFHSRHFTLNDRPVLAESQETGDYHLLTLNQTFHNEMIISLNLAHKDPQQRAVYQDRNFRIGLSHAINRERLVNAVFQEQGLPWQAAPVDGSKYFDQEFGTQYTQYDPDLANQILDDAGYDQRDGDGFRLRPDGERITITVHIAQGVRDFWNPGMELVAEDWAAVGIETVLDPMPRENWEALKSADDHDTNVWVGDSGHNDSIFLPRWYFAFDFDSHFGNAWQAMWRGEELEWDAPPPPEAMAEQQRLYDQLTTEPDEAARDELMLQILQIAKEQFWVIGTVRVPETFAIVKNNLHNVGGPMPEAATYNTPAPANPEQWFFSS
jgi:peptide/nickel transport system substrate-binding protein